MQVAIPPLPREIEADPRAGIVRARLDATARLLWSGAALAVPDVALQAPLARALADAHQGGDLVLGLEGIAEALASEARGLDALAARTAAPPAQRVSRLLFVADDGAERFYREVERVTRRHAPRLLTCRLGVGADVLGAAVAGRALRVKAILVQHKRAVAAVLRSLA
ncbi:MAG: hypothetical protein ACREQL_06345 [Candidatus Binatia bacterium]